MKLIKRWLLKQLSKRARTYLQSYGLLKTGRTFHRSAMVWEPGKGSVLVLSPHMDDEVIGCGGAICRHIQAGAEVTVVYMTDGRYGGILESYTIDDKRSKEIQLSEIRKNEAKLALKTMGVKEGIFLDAEELNLTSTKEIRKELKEIINRIKPEFVYIPFFLEEHPDHRATNQILLDATENTDFKFDCLGYEVWTPLFPNCFIDIGDVIEIKKGALKNYISQIDDTDFLHTALSLNAYRSSALTNKTRFAEAYFMASINDYRRLYQTYILESK